MALIAHYRMDGDATDSIGDNDGSVNGGVTWVDGRLGQAAKFNGSSEYISQPSISDYLHNRPEASIAMWVKKDAIQYGFFQLSGYASSNGNLYPYQTETKVYLDTFRTNRLGPIYMPTSVLEWHHFVVTQKPGEWKLYQNGELVHTAGANDFISTDYLQFEIGRNSSSRYANGQFDDVRVYDHALSEREVRDLSLAPAVQELSKELDNTTGTTDYITVTPSPAVLGDTSISFWVFPAATGSSRETIWDNGYGGEGTINFERGGSNLRFYSGPSGNNGSGYQQGNSSVIPLSTWSHAVVVRDMTNQEFRWYINGELTTTTNHTLTSIGESTMDLRIGTGYTNPFTGKLREVKQYATALTADQVKELYQQRASIDSEGNIFTALDEGVPYTSRLSSSEVSFAGNGYNNTSGESDPCSGLKTFEEALAYADARGGRLPTLDEMLNDATKGSGCSYDFELCWTADKGADDSEHWVAYGSAVEGPPEIRANTSTAYVRFVADDDLERDDPVVINDDVIREWLYL